MKKLFLILLLTLLSTHGIAKVGDTYYCIPSQHITLTDKGVEEQKLERLKIKSGKLGDGLWKQITFFITWGKDDGGGGFFIGGLEYESNWIDYKNVERYSGNQHGQTVHYDDGAFYFTMMGKEHISAIMAKCEPL